MSDLTKHMLASVNQDGFLEGWFRHLIDQKLNRLCESPIEIMLGAALLFYDRFNGCPGYPLALARHDEVWPPGEHRLLIPQYRFGNYRIDWVYQDGPNLTFIECDGHDFHERTKEQAGRDKLKDRTIQAAGHPVLRFTGSEIYKDPLHCAAQVAEFVDNRNIPAELREPA